MKTDDHHPNHAAQILIVEDSPTQAERLKFILERHGYVFTAARNGREALAAIQERVPDLVISDIVMPEMDGYQLCGHLKKDERLRSIPVILLTSLTDPIDVVKGLESGADNFIFKPYDEKYLLNRITYMLANRHLRENESTQMGVEIFFGGRKFFITSDRLQILNLLLSTYEAAVLKNHELSATRDELRVINKSLDEANRRLEREIVAREQSEAALREREERFQIMARATNDVVWDWDILTNGLWWSEAFKVVFGYRAEEIGPGVESWSKRIHPDDKERVLTNIHRVIDDGGHRWSDEYRFRRADGSMAFILDRGEIIRDAQGKAVRMVGAMMDITERKKAEAAIQQLNEVLHRRAAELETANKELESFSYSVSHDLRAPLRHIDGFAAKLSRHLGRERLDDTARRFLATISDSARNMGQLIDDLLAFSQIGRTEPRRIRVKLDELVAECRRTLEHDVNGRTVAWEIAPLPEVEGDAALLRQVFANLLGNAVKYTRRRPAARIEIGAQPAASGEVVVYVRDNGAGFDMKHAGKLFGVFQRLHADSEFEGTGVGLATVRRIVERHGGRIWAESAVDAGATFYFSLPTNRTNHDLQTL